LRDRLDRARTVLSRVGVGVAVGFEVAVEIGALASEPAGRC
jgi:hypothetical protein